MVLQYGGCYMNPTQRAWAYVSRKTTEKSHIILDSICLIGWNIGLFDTHEVQQNSRK